MKAFVKGFLKGLAGCAVLVVFVLAFCHFTGMTDWVKDSGQSMPAAADISQGEAEEEKIDEQKPDEQLPFKEQENSQPSIDQAPAEEETDVRILFAGDIYLPEALQSKYTKEGIPAIATEGVLTEMQDADLFVVNQEFPFGTTGEPMEDKQYTFRIHPKYVSVEEDLGVDLVTLANNHVLDYGRSPLAETLDTLKQAGIAYMGAGTDLKEASECKSFTIQNKKIGFLGASRVIPVAEWNAGKGVSGVFTTYDPARLLEEIEKAKETCDFVVVYVHWGIERNTIPEDYQRSLGQAYIEAGADAVIGSHPHVLQGVEFYQGKPIVYSLGNFIFNLRTYDTMLVELTLRGSDCQMRLIPCVSEDGQVRIMEDTAAFYNTMETLSFGVKVQDDGIIVP